jgi:TfoX/Sxy family transcriptional regulator of competence genes
MNRSDPLPLGATMPYTSLNGNMFSFLGESGLGLRLPEKEREEFLKKYTTTLYKAHGTTLKEYVVVPEKLFSSSKELKKYFQISYDYTSSLRPKPSKKKT